MNARSRVGLDGRGHEAQKGAFRGTQAPVDARDYRNRWSRRGCDRELAHPPRLSRVSARALSSNYEPSSAAAAATTRAARPRAGSGRGRSVAVGCGATPRRADGGLGRAGWSQGDIAASSCQIRRRGVPRVLIRGQWVPHWVGRRPCAKTARWSPAKRRDRPPMPPSRRTPPPQIALSHFSASPSWPRAGCRRVFCPYRRSAPPRRLARTPSFD